MFILLWVGVLVGILIASVEFTYLTISNGTFWLNLLVFSQSIMLYVLVSWAGLLPTFLLVRGIRRWRSLTGNSNREGLIYFYFAWLLGTALLAGLVWSDLEAGNQFIVLAVGLLLTGFLVSLILRLLLRHNVAIYKSVIVITVIVLTTTLGTYLYSDYRCNVELNNQTNHYHGNVPHACLVVLDAARGDHFSSNGYPFATTPSDRSDC